MIRLHDTAAGAVLPLEPRDPGKVSMYVCGPTVYGPPHLGHGRFSLVFDVLRRYLEWSGFDVTYVSNITDIEDKIIERAQREGRDWQDITAKCEAIWYRAMDALGVKRPDHDPHATAYVEPMVQLIERLVDAGQAYQTSDGVYLSVERIDGYGLLARQSLDDMRAGGGERSIVGEGEKRHPADFVLWKVAKPDEPSWPSPWGDGRPGWHTECVVMSLDLLGEGFDIHGGGIDLAFPHHENERAQAIGDAKTFARRWVHNGFVEVGGEKMSKSLGNFTNLLDLVDEHDPRSYRLLVLQAHYRSPVEVTAPTVASAEAALDRLDALARRSADLPAADPDPAALEAFRTAMDDDLDTPLAMAQVFGLVTEANRMLDAGDPGAAAPVVAAWREILGALGLEVSATIDDVPDDIAVARPPARRGPGVEGLGPGRRAARRAHRGGLVGRGLGSGHGRPSGLSPPGLGRRRRRPTPGSVVKRRQGLGQWSEHGGGVLVLGQVHDRGLASGLGQFVTRRGGGLRSHVDDLRGDLDLAGITPDLGAVPGQHLLLVAQDRGVGERGVPLLGEPRHRAQRALLAVAADGDGRMG